MKHYKILFNNTRHNVKCESMQIIDGVTVFISDGDILHIAPKEALIIDITAEFVDISIFKELHSMIERNIFTATKHIALDNQFKMLWEGQLQLAKSFKSEMESTLEKLEVEFKTEY